MPEKHISVVIDTNLWVSMAIGSKAVSESLFKIIADTNIEIFVSSELITEITETLSTPKLSKYLTKSRTAQLFELIWLKTRLIRVNNSFRICRDPKDDFILNLAASASAENIITGDKDLLVLNPFQDIQICTLTDFLENQQGLT